MKSIRVLIAFDNEHDGEMYVVEWLNNFQSKSCWILTENHKEIKKYSFLSVEWNKNIHSFSMIINWATKEYKKQSLTLLYISGKGEKRNLKTKVDL